MTSSLSFQNMITNVFLLNSSSSLLCVYKLLCYCALQSASLFIHFRLPRKQKNVNLVKNETISCCLLSRSITSYFWTKRAAQHFWGDLQHLAQSCYLCAAHIYTYEIGWSGWCEPYFCAADIKAELLFTILSVIRDFCLLLLCSNTQKITFFQEKFNTFWCFLLSESQQSSEHSPFKEQSNF